MGSHSGPSHTRASRTGPAGRLDRLHEALALGVLAHLGVEPEQLGHELGEALGVGAPLVQHLGEVGGAGHLARPGPVHGHVAVPLEQAHHPRDLREGEPLLGRGQHAHDAGLAGRVAPGPHLGGHPLDHLGEVGRVAREGAEQLGDETDEVVAQPGHGRELHAVGHLVQRQPEPELAGGEAVLQLDRHDVGADVGDQILVLGRLVVDQEVVLAEHPGRHVGEHQAELGAGHGTTNHQRRPAELGAPGPLELEERRADQPLDGAHVGAAQPGRSVTLARADPCRECRPVASLTRVSARAVRSSNWPWRADDRYVAGEGLRSSAPDATRWARTQSTMAGTAGASGEGTAGESSALTVVLPAFLVEGRGHPLDQALGHPVLAPVGDDPAQLGLELGRSAAGAAVVQMDPDLLAPHLGELAVEVVVQLVHRFLAVQGRAEQARCVGVFAHVPGHSLVPPGTLPTSPRASATSCNAFWSALLPRWIRLMTVPMGTSVISEISL